MEHYFSGRPKVASHPVPVHLQLPDIQLELLSDRGVFAYGQVDRGTQLLLRTAPSPPPGELLDLGCGYGAIAVTLARRCPSCRVWGVDVNERALALCAENARRAGLANVQAVLPHDVPQDLHFAAIYANPPIRVGKEQLHDLLLHWLERLQTSGHAYLVVQRALGSDSLASWLTLRGYTVERLRSRIGYRVLDIHGATGSHHHERRDS